MFFNLFKVDKNYRKRVLFLNLMQCLLPLSANDFRENNIPVS